MNSLFGLMMLPGLIFTELFMILGGKVGEKSDDLKTSFNTPRDMCSLRWSRKRKNWISNCNPNDDINVKSGIPHQCSSCKKETIVGKDFEDYYKFYN